MHGNMNVKHKRPLGKIRCRWDDNIQVNLMDWLYINYQLDALIIIYS